MPRFVRLSMVLAVITVLPACRSGFLHQPDPCDGISCSGHGACALDTHGQAVCLCETGYHQEDRILCVQDADPCLGMDCSGHGECAVTVYNQALCVCDPGYHNGTDTTCIEDEIPVQCTGPADCDDLNDCTQDDCHDDRCTHDPLTDNTPCDDQNACTGTDLCQVGVCQGNDPVMCSPLDQCHQPGTCDPLTGLCSDPPQPDGTACDDQDACTSEDQCTSGICAGVLKDEDQDGYPDVNCGGDDCNDEDANVNPGNPEEPPGGPLCVNGIDDDCDGHTDLEELSCWDPVYTPDGWRWLSPLPTGADLYALSVVSANEIFVVGDGDVILYWDGVFWSSQSSGTGENLRGIFAFSASDAWAVGENGTILHYDGSWQVVPSPTGEHLHDVWGPQPDRLWAVGEAGTILKYEEPIGWSAEPSPTAEHLHALWGPDGTDMWAVGTSGVTFRGDGHNWVEVSNPIGSRITGVHGTASDDVWTVSDFSPGEMMYFDGSAWTVVMENNFRMKAVWMAGPDLGFASGFDGSTFKYTQSGGWQYNGQVPYGRNSLDIEGAAGDDIWIVGANGGIARGSGELGGWEDQTSAYQHYACLEVWATAPDDVWVACFDAGTRRFDGQGWHTETTLLGGTPVGAVFGFGPDDVWVAGQVGSAAHFDGNGWTARHTGTDHFLGGIFGFSSSDLWVCGSGLVHWDGTGWTEAVNPVTDTISAIWGASPGELWAVTTGGDILLYDGQTWEVHTGVGENMQSIWGVAADDIWAVGQNDTLVHYDGVNWTIGSIGNGEHLKAVWGRASDDFWVIASTPPNTFPNTIYHYDGGGWTPVERMNRHLNGIFGLDTGELWVAGGGTSVLYKGP